MSKARPLYIILLLGVMLAVMWAADFYVRSTVPPSSPRSIVEARTGFTPSRNGFPYINHAGGGSGTLLNKLAPGICGGMSYAALDFYAAHASPPARGAESFVLLRDAGSVAANAASFVLWTLSPDLSRDRSTLGLATATRTRQIPDLSLKLRQGPVPLGLVKADTLTRMASNHQVVAYALERHDSLVIVRIYDPNHPSCDDSIITVDLADDGRAIQYCRGKAVDRWRGFFIEDYVPLTPPRG